MEYKYKSTTWNHQFFLVDQVQNTLEIPYSEIPCNKASLLRARHASP